MDLSKEGDELSRKLMETFRSFVIETITQERIGENVKSVPKLENGIQGDISYDLVKIMKDLFVVNPSYVRTEPAAIGVEDKQPQQEIKPLEQSENIQGELFFTDKNRKRSSKFECAEVGKLMLIEKGIAFDDGSCDNEEQVFEDFAQSKALANTKEFDCRPQFGNSLVQSFNWNKDDTVPMDGRSKNHENVDEGGSEGGNNLFDSADSGVFENMGGLHPAPYEAEFAPRSEKIPKKLAMYSEGQNHNRESLNSRENSTGKLYSCKGSSCESLSGSISVTPGGERKHSCSRIPIFTKSRRRSVAAKKPSEQGWMKSLQESIERFREYDFGSTPSKSKIGTYDRSKSLELNGRLGTTSENTKRTRLKSAQSMMSLNQISSRFEDSSSFWKQRTSLEKNYSRYLEDEKQVLKDVKCDIEYEQASDLARRRLNEAKRRKSRSLFDLSTISESMFHDFISPEIRKYKGDLKGTGFSRPSKFSCASKDLNNNVSVETDLFIRKSKIPVFIGYV